MEGILIPIGGAECKGACIDAAKSVLSEVMAQSTKKNLSKILIIPTASSLQREVSQEYAETFAAMGCAAVSTAYITTRRCADSEENLRLLSEADIVMFSGGDQSKIASAFIGTEFLRVLQERFERERIVVAGTSAGAMCMSGEMIAGGHIDTNALFRGSVRFSKGLGLAPGLIIDTHFIKRGRFGRLTEAVSLHPGCLGIGLAEDTGIIIRDGGFRVVGSGMAIIFDPSDLGGAEDHSSVTDLRVHILSEGDTFSLADRKPALRG